MRLPATTPAVGTRRRAWLMLIFLAHALQAAAYVESARRMGPVRGQRAGDESVSAFLRVWIGPGVFHEV